MEVLVNEQIVRLVVGDTGKTLVSKLKKSFSHPIFVIRVNGKLRDLNTPLSNEDRVELLGFMDKEGKKVFWHSSAHLLAQAVTRLFPEAKPTIGPAIEEGFFYDFADLNITEEDFPRIEAEIRKTIKKKTAPQRIELGNEQEARQVFTKNPFKQELIREKEEGLSAYRQDEFVDLCAGPHLPHFGHVKALKLLKTSGAYWRGDSKNQQLTRIYGISFPESEMLSEYLKCLEEKQRRDHRILGKKLNLFSFPEEGPGMPLFHPKGMILWDELTGFMRLLHKKYDYSEIKTPVILSRELWETSGHWENYRDHMYTCEIDEKQFVIKPMNCPGCLLYYKSSPYSYRNLPLRIAEIGHVHRHELSGALSGLFRVRSFHQDDAHIFMLPKDMKREILQVLKLADEVYSTLGLKYHLELSTRPEKSIGTDEQWKEAIGGLLSALKESKKDFSINEGDGAFYGPKIDFHIQDAIGRSWQCGTIQLDMALPDRFDLLYDDTDGIKKRPIMIHRAIYGSIERFIGILIEHYVGRFPLWLSPVQIRLLTVADRHISFAKRIFSLLEAREIRVSLDTGTESISKKVRNAQMDQVNYILVLGDKEEESGALNIRTREGKSIVDISPEKLVDTLVKEKETKELKSLLGIIRE